MSNTAWWYVARSSGLVAWLFLVATVVVGALAAGRLVSRKGATRWLSDIHPWLSMLSVLLVVLHISAIVADSTIKFTWLDAIVPFASQWRPAAIAWGVLGVWLIGAITVTSLARRWIPRRVWHGVHLLSYVLAGAVTVHAITAGTDLANPLVARAVALVTIVALAVSLRRAMQTSTSASRNRSTRTSASRNRSTPHSPGGGRSAPTPPRGRVPATVPVRVPARARAEAMAGRGS
jgi:predicted ferric reductase